MDALQTAAQAISRMLDANAPALVIVVIFVSFVRVIASRLGRS
jgi:hypothetical protein